MPLASRLFAFAAVLTVLLAGYRAVDFWRGKNHKEVVIAHVNIEAPKAVIAPTAVEIPVPPVPPVPLAVEADEVRILTENGAAFMALRNDMLVGGLSDSIKAAIGSEMSKEVAGKNFIEKAVLKGVGKLVQHEIELPIHELKSIDYKGGRIVLQYRNGKAPGVINFETINTDENGPLLAQFGEEDARKLVAAVRAKLAR